jgi:D-alanyl-D-alanine carboxypeptidase (penicillin-binding protein 5/6)
MKKSNVLVIAAILFALHIVVFIAVIGKRDKPAYQPPAEPQPPVAESVTREPITENPIPEFQVPELKLLEAPPAQEPETVETAPLREQIAVPGSKEGFIRSDRTERRTTQSFASLVGDPYQGAIVIDARTGKILYEKRASVYAYPASVTKMMTMLIVLEQIDAGIIHLNDRVKITDEIAGIGGSGVYLDVRESEAFTVHQMLEALMIHSANDAATALAVHVAGSVGGFVDMMNQKARELGMNSTLYHSPHGLPPSGNAQPDISTAYDIAILSLAVLRHPETLTYTSTKLSWLPTNQLRKEKFMLANRNALVGKAPYPGCDGLKTGYHAKGGFSLAATAQQGDERVIAVILGVPDRNSRNATVRTLLDKGFELIRQ